MESIEMMSPDQEPEENTVEVNDIMNLLVSLNATVETLGNEITELIGSVKTPEEKPNEDPDKNPEEVE
ncbi:MAG: hypothetical protein M0P01_15030 [Treponema sp.]|nr:hypothetical protein [Treponema sp.]